MRRRRKKIDLVLKIVLSLTKETVRRYIAGMAKATAIKFGELNIYLPRSL